MFTCYFTGYTAQIEEGIDLLQQDLSFRIQKDGLCFHVNKVEGDTFTVQASPNQVTIDYPKPFMFYRAFALALAACKKGKTRFHITQTCRFDTNGLMFDVAQGSAAPKVSTILRLIRLLATMGLSMLMIYTEDNYVLENEPYFGHMRPRYTMDEWRKIDAYAAKFGVDCIPCIQTLAHLGDFLKWSNTSHIRDDKETLLVGCEQTYELIEHMLSTIKGVFRTNRIHLGMDEAWNLGLGQYLKRNGYTPKFDIMSQHLDRVMALVRKYGYKPMIWSDMFYRAGTRDGSYYEPSLEFPRHVLDRYPKDCQLVYWDYDAKEQAQVERMIDSHRKFGNDPIFAGGIWGWSSFSVHWQRTLETTQAALMAAKRKNVREVFATVWGDCGAEANLFANMLGLQLYAEHGYRDTVDESVLQQSFEDITKAKYQDFVSFEYINRFTKEDNDIANASKTLMWQDVLMGMFDWHIEKIDCKTHYEAMRMKMEKASTRNDEWNYIFEQLIVVCDVLSIKADIGVRLKKAYDADDRSMLESLKNEVLPTLKKKMKKLHQMHRTLWMRQYNPIGWELFDVKYGFVLQRIDTCIIRLDDYLNGRTDAIEELEQPRLPFSDKRYLPNTNSYDQIISGSRIVM